MYRAHEDDTHQPGAQAKPCKTCHRLPRAIYITCTKQQSSPVLWLHVSRQQGEGKEEEIRRAEDEKGSVSDGGGVVSRHRRHRHPLNAEATARSRVLRDKMWRNF